MYALVCSNLVWVDAKFVLWIHPHEVLMIGYKKGTSKRNVSILARYGSSFLAICDRQTSGLNSPDPLKCRTPRIA